MTEFDEHRIQQLEQRVDLLEQNSINLPYCVCKEDWTDGTAYCQRCHKEKKFFSYA